MTFKELLSALQMGSPRVRKLDRLISDSDDLVIRLQSAPRPVTREWGNQELLKIFITNNYNLMMEIPCKHCTK